MMDEITGTDSVKDNTGFVDHLRLTHLTLCVICLIGVVAIASQSASSASRAYDQTNFLLKLGDKWQDGKWLDIFAATKQMSNASMRLEIDGALTKPILDLSPLSGNSFGRFPHRFAWLAIARDTSRGLEALRERAEREKKFDTIADAQKIWDLLGQYRYTIVPNGARRGWLANVDGTFSELHIKNFRTAAVTKNNPSPDTDGRSVFILRQDLLDYLSSEKATDRTVAAKLVTDSGASCFLASSRIITRFGMPMPVVHSIFEAECTTEKIDLQALLGEGILQLGFPPGDFQHSFPDVGELAKDLKSLSLTELQTFFRSEKDRAGDKVEFPGFKLPVDSVAYWGSFIVFVVTVYFFSVFRDFCLRVAPSDKAWDVPWIGISREIASRCVFIATTLLPVISVGYLIFNGVDRGGSVATRCAFASLGALAVAAPIWGIIRSWTRLQHIGRAV